MLKRQTLSAQISRNRRKKVFSQVRNERNGCNQSKETQVLKTLELKLCTDHALFAGMAEQLS